MRPADGRDLREALCEKLTRKGWTLRRLELQRRTLEEAFFDVLREENPLREAPAIRPGGEAVQDLAGQAAAKKD